MKAVLTHENVPRVLHAGSPHPRSASVTKDQYILDDKVRYWGEGVAAVAATSEEIAEEALDLIDVDYEPLARGLHRRSRDGAEAAPSSTTTAFPATTCCRRCIVRRGDVERGFAEADLVLEGEYRARPADAGLHGAQRLHLPVGRATASSPSGPRPNPPSWSAASLAEVLGLPLNKVRVLVDHMGGGFGAKQDLFQHEFLCALLAQARGRPVRMEFTRKETFLGGRTRHPAKIWLKQGFRKDGTIVARQARLVFNSGAYGSHGPGVTNRRGGRR